jgi:hypothetical protein
MIEISLLVILCIFAVLAIFVGKLMLSGGDLPVTAEWIEELSLGYWSHRILSIYAHSQASRRGWRGSCACNGTTFFAVTCAASVWIFGVFQPL